MNQQSNNRRNAIEELPVGHFLGHVKNELAIPIFDFAQQAAKLVEKACAFADTAPGDVVRRLALGEIRQLRRFLTVIKEFIEWALERAGQLLQRFRGRGRLTILNTRYVKTMQTSTPFACH